jgi:hypothetical protein
MPSRRSLCEHVFLKTSHNSELSLFKTSLETYIVLADFLGGGIRNISNFAHEMKL